MNGKFIEKLRQFFSCNCIKYTIHFVNVTKFLRNDKFIYVFVHRPIFLIRLQLIWMKYKGKWEGGGGMGEYQSLKESYLEARLYCQIY